MHLRDKPPLDSHQTSASMARRVGEGEGWCGVFLIREGGIAEEDEEGGGELMDVDEQRSSGALSEDFSGGFFPINLSYDFRLVRKLISRQPYVIQFARVSLSHVLIFSLVVTEKGSAKGSHVVVQEISSSLACSLTA